MKPHKHAELIHAWANGARIEFREPGKVREWTEIDTPGWVSTCEYRIKPDPQYPETTMSGADLLAEWRGGHAERASDLRRVANAAIRYEIDAGHLAPKEAYAQCQRELIHAEQLLESLGYRRAEDGTWNEP